MVTIYDDDDDDDDDDDAAMMIMMMMMMMIYDGDNDVENRGWFWFEISKLHYKSSRFQQIVCKTSKLG